MERKQPKQNGNWQNRKQWNSGGGQYNSTPRQSYYYNEFHKQNHQFKQNQTRIALENKSRDTYNRPPPVDQNDTDSLRDYGSNQFRKYDQSPSQQRNNTTTYKNDHNNRPNYLRRDSQYDSPYPNNTRQQNRDDRDYRQNNYPKRNYNQNYQNNSKDNGYNNSYTNNRNNNNNKYDQNLKNTFPPNTSARPTEIDQE